MLKNNFYFINLKSADSNCCRQIVFINNLYINIFFMIPTFEQFVNENTMRTQKEDVAKILDAKKTFYSKKWQGNGYYPIHKYEWIEGENTWEEFVQKIEGGKETWLSYGLVRSPQPEKVTDREWLEFPFIHASYILSFNEMKDNKHYNDL